MTSTNATIGDDPYAGLDFESRTYIALHDAMMKAYFDKEHQKCIRLAEDLLTKAAIPDLIRARCNMILSLRNNEFSVGLAEQAIALIEGTRELVTEDEFPQDQLEEAHRCLQAAKDRPKKKAGSSGAGKDMAPTPKKDAE